MSLSLGSANELFIASMGHDLHWLRRLLRPRDVRDVSPVADVDWQPELFVDQLAACITRYEIDLVLPNSDQVAVACVRDAERLGAAVPLPGFETFVQALDKWETFKLANSLSLPLPRTLSSEDPAEIGRWMADEALDYPLIVKPRKRGGKTGTVVVRSPAELESALATFKAIGSGEPYHNHRMPLIQEYIRGTIHDCSVLYNRGEIRASFTNHRVRGTSAHGGAASVATSTDEPQLKDATQVLMDALSWHGPAQVEWLREAATGTYKLLEVNPRFWGTLRLPVAAGIDFPAMTVAMMRDGDVEPRFEYRAAVTLRNAIPDELQSIWRYDSNKLSALMRFLNPLDLVRRDTVFNWRWSDPLPHVFRVIHFSRKLLERRLVD